MILVPFINLLKDFHAFYQLISVLVKSLIFQTIFFNLFLSLSLILRSFIFIQVNCSSYDRLGVNLLLLILETRCLGKWIMLSLSILMLSISNFKVHLLKGLWVVYSEHVELRFSYG